MLVSGCTIVRNANRFRFPVLEAIRSILPICDEFIVNVGQSDDGTLESIKSIKDDKLKIIPSLWADRGKSGETLSTQTNMALEKCSAKFCFYIQADEVVHENDLETILKNISLAAKSDSVEGLLFDYNHFYGGYGYTATARNWYRREVRIIRNGLGINSHGDAQGFRLQGRKPQVMHSGGRIFHYGWVRPPEVMGKKTKHFFRLWHGNRYDDTFDNFTYENMYGLRKYTDTHPAVMNDLVKSQSWNFNPNELPRKYGIKELKNISSDLFEKMTGLRIGEHKNYELLKETHNE